MRYYISDHHFFHENIIRMDGRPFETLEEMHEYMISQWNKRIHKNDEVVILGDISMGNAEQTTEVLKRLKGRKYLIVGNHDRFLEDKSFDTSLFKFIGSYHEMNDNKRKVVLCHYPILCYNGQFRRDGEGKPKTYMLHGHIHNTQDVVGLEHAKEFVRNYPRETRQGIQTAPVNIINCYCGFSNYIPLTLDEWIEKENKGELKVDVRVSYP